MVYHLQISTDYRYYCRTTRKRMRVHHFSFAVVKCLGLFFPERTMFYFCCVHFDSCRTVLQKKPRKVVSNKKPPSFQGAAVLLDPPDRFWKSTASLRAANMKHAWQHEADEKNDEDAMKYGLNWERIGLFQATATKTLNLIFEPSP